MKYQKHFQKVQVGISDVKKKKCIGKYNLHLLNSSTYAKKRTISLNEKNLYINNHEP